MSTAHEKEREYMAGCIKTDPIAVRLHIDANRGTPALAGMIADILTKAGAKVTASDPRVQLGLSNTDLRGLHVHIDRLTWVTNSEAERWAETR